MFKFLFKSKCVSETEGTIVKVRYNDGSRRVTVEFFVNGQAYIIKENITVKSIPIKAGKIPIGQRKIEYITEGIGEKVFVKYNPGNPKQAYLRDNVGYCM